MTAIKICGLSTPESVDTAIEAGATHIGLVHYEPSPRHVTLKTAESLRVRARGKAQVVLLTVNAEPQDLARAFETVRPDILQFHGRETPEWLTVVKRTTGAEVWKALGMRDAETLEKSRRYKGAADRLLFDAPARKLPGGNGETFDWGLLADFDHTIAWGLAGGLQAGNVAQAIRATGAALVDASSGVESARGVKDMDLIRAFCKAAGEA